jgi:hypothetical protein
MLTFGVSQWFVDRIKGLYDKAEASLQINGSLSGNIPIKCGVRQGCPLSVVLYAMCIQRFLQNLVRNLPAVRIGRRGQQSPVIAYADDVTIFVQWADDFARIQQAVQTYEKESEALLNAGKSQALAVEKRAARPTLLAIDLRDGVTILGVSFGQTVSRTMSKTWDKTTKAVRAIARQAYFRNLCVAQRVQFVHQNLLAEIWYVA